MGTGTVALVKHPRPLTADVSVPRAREAEFDRQAVLERLFDLPIPPLPSARRSYPIHTPLGRIMRLQGKQKQEVSASAGCPNDRVLTEILSGRQKVGEHRCALAAAVGVDPRVL